MSLVTTLCNFLRPRGLRLRRSKAAVLAGVLAAGWSPQLMAADDDPADPRVYAADGTWTHLPPDAPPENVREGAVDWTYTGLATFTAPSDTGSRRFVGVSEGGHDDRQLVKVDSAGLRWSGEIDADALEVATRTYEARFPPEPDHATESDAVPIDQATESAETVIELQAQWLNDDCDGDGDNDVYWYTDATWKTEVMPPGESLYLDYTAVLSVDSGAFGCSGVFVDDDKVLTAAHCVIDENTGLPFDIDDITICTRGNMELSDPLDQYDDPYCWGTVLWAITDGYTGGNDYDDDFALVRFFRGGVLPPAPAWMPISSASAATVEAADVLRTAYPGFSESCTDLTSSPFTSAVPWGNPAMEIMNEQDVVVSAHRIKTNMDCAGGESGASYYYVPSFTPYSVGIHDYYAPFEAYCGGVRASEYRSFVIANL